MTSWRKSRTAFSTTGKAYARYSLAIGAAAALVAVTLPTSASAGRVDSTSHNDQRYVIYFEPDGFDPRYLEWFDTPNIDALIERGAYAEGRSVFKATSQVARASIVTGAYPEVTNHQAYYYDFEREEAVRDESPSAPEVPLGAETIGQVIAETEGVNFAAVAYPQLLNHGASRDDPENLYVGAPASCDREDPAAIDAAIDMLNVRPVDVGGGVMVTVPRIPELLFVRCVDTDLVGHAEGPFGPSVPDVVADVDLQVGRLVQATKDVGIYDDTTFIFGADHGVGAISVPLLPDVLDYLDATGYSWEVVPWGQAVSSPSIEIIMNATSRSLSIHLRGDAATQHGRKDVARALSNLDGRAIVHDRHDLDKLHAGDRVGDFALSPLEPYHLSTDIDRGPGGGHSGAQEMRVPFVIAGDGIAPGSRVKKPEIVDIVPTIAKLLDIREPAEAQGRVLEEVLIKKK